MTEADRAKLRSLRERCETPEARVQLLHLAQAFDADAALNEHTDAEVAKLLVEHLWADFPITDPRSTLVMQAVERLRRASLGPLRPSNEDVPATPSLPR